MSTWIQFTGAGEETMYVDMDAMDELYFTEETKGSIKVTVDLPNEVTETFHVPNMTKGKADELLMDAINFTPSAVNYLHCRVVMMAKTETTHINLRNATLVGISPTGIPEQWALVVHYKSGNSTKLFIDDIENTRNAIAMALPGRIFSFA
jgi:hypothetical protein